MTNPTFWGSSWVQKTVHHLSPHFLCSGPKNAGPVLDKTTRLFEKNKGPKNRFQRQPEKTVLPHLRFTYQNLLAASGPASPKRSEPECCDTTGEKKNATGQDKAIHKFPFKGTILLWEMHVNPTLYGFFSGGGTTTYPPIQFIETKSGIYFTDPWAFFVRR